MEIKEKKQKAKTKPKEKTTRISMRIEEKKLQELQKIFSKKNPLQKNSTTDLIKNSIDFFLENNKNVKVDEEISNIKNEISQIKNLKTNEKMNSFDNRIFKNLQKNFTLKFEEEEIFFIIKNIFQSEIQKTEYIDQKNSDQIFLFIQDEEEFFLRTKNFIFRNLRKKYQKIKPYLYEILYRKIYGELPNSEEEVKKFYDEYIKNIIFLNIRLRTALQKSVFGNDEELKNFQKEISPKINEIKKYIDNLLSVLERCNEKK